MTAYSAIECSSFEKLSTTNKENIFNNSRKAHKRLAKAASAYRETEYAKEKEKKDE